MKAIDTNVLVRFIVRDDVDQAIRARTLIEAGDIFLPLAVTLEAEWVLRAGYGLDRATFVRTLRAFLGLPGVTAEALDDVVNALDLTEQGFDFADALHLTASANHDAFLTFDRKLIRRAGDLQGPPVREP